jgi:hypothetical protein
MDLRKNIMNKLYTFYQWFPSDAFSFILALFIICFLFITFCVTEIHYNKKQIDYLRKEIKTLKECSRVGSGQVYLREKKYNE